jgi:hypothetical protein
MIWDLEGEEHESKGEEDYLYYFKGPKLYYTLQAPQGILVSISLSSVQPRLNGHRMLIVVVVSWKDGRCDDVGGCVLALARNRHSGYKHHHD